MKALSATFGICLVLATLIVCGVSLVAIVDPVGAKMADDSDPFGPPPSRLSSLAMFGASVVVGAAGGYLVYWSFRSRSCATTDA